MSVLQLTAVLCLVFAVVGLWLTRFDRKDDQ